MGAFFGWLGRHPLPAIAGAVLAVALLVAVTLGIASAFTGSPSTPEAETHTPDASPGTSLPPTSPAPSQSPRPTSGTATPNQPTPEPAVGASRIYPVHTGIVATTFWVGEIFDPNASDGSQMLSTYDGSWFANYGGCDGVTTANGCQTEARTAANGYFPTAMTPRQNPFYLDLPYDDLNNAAAFASRGTTIPWAGDPGYAGHETDSSFSYMKNRWVRITLGNQTCYGQIEDAGPGQYNDVAYVFGSTDARPANTEFNGAGMDVSPALNGCLGFRDLNGENDVVSWQFVEASDVPPGPWLDLVTTSGITN